MPLGMNLAPLAFSQRECVKADKDLTIFINYECTTCNDIDATASSSCKLY